MSYQIRYARPDEFAAVTELDGASFGFHYSEQESADSRLDLELDRIKVATDGDRLVAISAELTLELTLPGGAIVPTTGLTWVSVELTDRRRGVLRSVVESQLRERAAAGDAALILGASEGGIYGRYGFGVAIERAHLRVERRRARTVTRVDTGAVRRLPSEQARDLLPGLYERWRRGVAGGVGRVADRWAYHFLDREYVRHGASGLFHLVHPDGYLSYRVRDTWTPTGPEFTGVIVDYAPITDEAHAALWQVLLDMDLVTVIESTWVPVDDPLRQLLTDPRGVDMTHLVDGLWLRPLDVARLLGERRYGVEVSGVLEVSDGVLGDGRYQLTGGPDGASCTRTDRRPDLRLGVADLGAVLLGGTRLSRIARTGRVGVEDPAALRRLDRALLVDRGPAYGTGF